MAVTEPIGTDELQALGITPGHDLPGVGRNLQDHPAIGVHYQGRPETVAAPLTSLLCQEMRGGADRAPSCR